MREPEKGSTMPKPQRTHTVAVTVTCDKPCSQAEAVHMVRDCVHGDFYPLPNHAGVGEFRIRGVKSLSAAMAAKLKKESKWIPMKRKESK